MKRLTGILAFVVGLAVCVPVHADEETKDLRTIRSIDDGEGSARILFRVSELAQLDGIAIRRATLRVPLQGQVDQRTINLRVYPVTTTWNEGTVTWTNGWTRPGGDFDEEVFGRGTLELASGASELQLDVTGLLKEVVEMDLTSDGFIVSVAPGDGIGLDSDDVSRLRLAEAEVEVRYRRIRERNRG